MAGYLSANLILLRSYRENANSVPATCWFVLEAIQNADLLRRVRSEVQSCFHTSPARENHFDVERLCSQPLLQSMFAETLRLRTIQFIVRGSDHEDFRYQNWIVPKGQIVAVDTHTAHTNGLIWGTGGPGNPHPVKEFWAEIDASDPESGPLRHRSNAPDDTMKDLESASNKKGPKFSLSGLGGAWIPFGGGRRQCPGRIFAKQEIILSAAIFCSAFEIELLAGAKPEPNMRYYGLGGLPPKREIPCRIRRRADYRA